MTYVGFRAHVKVTSRIVSYRMFFGVFLSKSNKTRLSTFFELMHAFSRTLVPVCVVVVAVLVEVRGHPAVDGVADELFGGDEDGEADEQCDGRAVAQTVRVVVVASRLGVRYRAESDDAQ